MSEQTGKKDTQPKEEEAKFDFGNSIQPEGFQFDFGKNSSENTGEFKFDFGGDNTGEFKFGELKLGEEKKKSTPVIMSVNF